MNLNTASLLGRLEEEAKFKILAEHMKPRVIRRGEKVFPTTLGFRVDRVNLEIGADGKVEKASVG